MLIDTHCHIHEADYPLDADEVIGRANQADVMRIICVGTNIKTSQEAIEFTRNRENIFASVGIHPHFAKDEIGFIDRLVEDINREKVIAIGEIGLDYFYDNSPRENQIALLESQIQLALKYDLPIIFHVRDAFDDFWTVFDKYSSIEKPIRGVLHCYTDSWENAEKAIERGLYFGINGISTFTNDEVQKKMFSQLPLDKILLETDAPALTPSPLRGKVKVNEPAYIHEIAEFGSEVHKISVDEFAQITTANARSLFNL